MALTILVRTCEPARPPQPGDGGVERLPERAVLAHAVRHLRADAVVRFPRAHLGDDLLLCCSIGQLDHLGLE